MPLRKAVRYETTFDFSNSLKSVLNAWKIRTRKLIFLQHWSTNSIAASNALWFGNDLSGCKAANYIPITSLVRQLSYFPEKSSVERVLWLKFQRKRTTEDSFLKNHFYCQGSNFSQNKKKNKWEFCGNLTQRWTFLSHFIPLAIYYKYFFLIWRKWKRRQIRNITAMSFQCCQLHSNASLLTYYYVRLGVDCCHMSDKYQLMCLSINTDWCTFSQFRKKPTMAMADTYLCPYVLVWLSNNVY